MSSCNARIFSLILSLRLCFVEVQNEHQLRPYNSETKQWRILQETKMFFIVDAGLKWCCSPFQINYALLPPGFSLNLYPLEQELLFLPQLIPLQGPAHDSVFLVNGGNRYIKDRPTNIEKM
jgi:hypothetical protein